MDGLRIGDFHQTFIDPTRTDLLPVADWLWDPWEYATVGDDDLHRTNPTHPGHTMCGQEHRGLLGTPAWARGEHCPACVATPAPAPREGYRFEFARCRRLPDGRRADVVSIQHTTATTPDLWELLPADDWPRRDVTAVITSTGWALEDGPHYDPRTDTTWARVTPAGPLQTALF